MADDKGLVIEQPKTGLTTDFGVKIEALRVVVAADMELTINGVGDEAGLVTAKTRLREYVRQRNAVKKRQTELNAEARAHMTRVGEVANELQGIIAPAEVYLDGIIDAVEKEREDIVTTALDKTFNERNAKLLAAGIVLDRIVVDVLTDEQIDQRIADKRELDRLKAAEDERLAKEKAEADRIQKEQAEANRAEAMKLATERAELDKQRAAMAEQQKKIDEANQEIERKERQRVAEEQRQQREAERIAAEKVAESKRISDEAQAKIDREAEETRRAALAEAVRPDKEKLSAYIARIDYIPIPEVREACNELRDAIEAIMESCLETMREIVC